jgi:hypothetical protein
MGLPVLVSFWKVEGYSRSSSSKQMHGHTSGKLRKWFPYNNSFNNPPNHKFFQYNAKYIVDLLLWYHILWGQMPTSALRKYT